MAAAMDVVPNQIFRLAQLGKLERAARSQAIWLCVSCFTCTARCPKSVDCVGIIDALREMSLEKGWVAPELQRVRLFQQAFLDNIRKNGRINEVELIQRFKLSGFLNDFSVPLLMKDAMLAPKLMQRGKFHVFGEKVKDRDIVRRIFDRCQPQAVASGATEKEAVS